MNDARGLEHGFTVATRPNRTNGTHATPDSHASLLSFTMATRGNLKPSISADAQGVLFADASSATVLNSTGLKVWDADGQVLASHVASAQGGVRLLVEEGGARYPLTIDPIAQQAYLKAAAVGTTQAGDEFGRSVTVSGDTVVVGAGGEDSGTTGVNSTPNESASYAGAAYIFTGLGSAVPDADGHGLLDSWELTYWPTIFGHSALDDFDHDRYAELLELALGLNPTLPNAGGLPVAINEGGYLTMTITKQPGVTYEVQSAGTLLPALPDSFSAASTTVLTNNATTLKVRDNILIGTPPSRHPAATQPLPAAEGDGGSVMK